MPHSRRPVVSVGNPLAGDDGPAWPDRSPGAHAISPLVALKLFRILHPAASTRFSLVGLFSEAIRLFPVGTRR